MAQVLTQNKQQSQDYSDSDSEYDFDENCENKQNNSNKFTNFFKNIVRKRNIKENSTEYQKNSETIENLEESFEQFKLDQNKDNNNNFEQNTTNTNQTQQKNIQNEENIKELIIGGGAGALAFATGYVHALIEIVGKEKLKEFKINCVSAGAIIGLVLHFVVRQDKYDMRYFYNEWFRKVYEKENKKYFGLFTCGKLLRESSVKLIKMIEDNNIETLDDNVTLGITTFGKWGMPKSTLVSQFNGCSEQLGDSLESTCGIPFLLKFGVFVNFKGQKAVDGGLTNQIPYRYENSQKIFLNIFPKQAVGFPFVLKKHKNLQQIHITENSNVSFPLDYWIWDENWADEMFMRGILAAKKDTEKLIKTFQ